MVRFRGIRGAELRRGGGCGGQDAPARRRVFECSFAFSSYMEGSLTISSHVTAGHTGGTSSVSPFSRRFASGENAMQEES